MAPRRRTVPLRGHVQEPYEQHNAPSNGADYSTWRVQTIGSNNRHGGFQPSRSHGERSCPSHTSRLLTNAPHWQDHIEHGPYASGKQSEPAEDETCSRQESTEQSTLTTTTIEAEPRTNDHASTLSAHKQALLDSFRTSSYSSISTSSSARAATKVDHQEPQIDMTGITSLSASIKKMSAFDPHKYGRPTRLKVSGPQNVPTKGIKKSASNDFEARSDVDQAKWPSRANPKLSVSSDVPIQMNVTEENVKTHGKHSELPSPKITKMFDTPIFDPSNYGRPKASSVKHSVRQESPAPESIVSSPDLDQAPSSAPIHNTTSFKSEDTKAVAAAKPPPFLKSGNDTVTHSVRQTADHFSSTSKFANSRSVGVEVPSQPVSSLAPIIRDRQPTQTDYIKGGIESDLKMSNDDRSPCGPAAPRSHQKSITPQRVKSSPPKPGLVPAERLKAAQEKALREIGLRNMMKGGQATTSLFDLELARTPLKFESEAASNPNSAHPKKNFDNSKLSGISPVQKRAKIQQHANRFQEPETGYHSITYDTYSALEPADSSFSGQQNLPKAQDACAHGSDIIMSKSASRRKRNQKWVAADEIRPVYEKRETDSNAWGSEAPSDAEAQSNDSLQAMHHGKLFRGPPAGPDPSLAGWDGKIQPPPPDWNCRPRFNNNSSEFKNGFNNWAIGTAALLEAHKTDSMFRVVPKEQVLNIALHPDGIGMVERDFLLNKSNVEGYGYNAEDLSMIADLTRSPEQADFECHCKMDPNDDLSQTRKEETVEYLLHNWLGHQEEKRQRTTLETVRRRAAMEEANNYVPAPNSNKPIANIYIRPVVKADMQQLTDIYNWHVENSVRTCEVRNIDISNMRERYDATISDKLPFIVAVLKNKNKTGRNYNSLTQTQEEVLVGFAAAVMFTAPDYVEHISAELELYVHAQFLRQGIGRCLMDRLLASTDRGHMVRGGYPFHCDPVHLHGYDGGGARSLHKILFVVRNISRPRRDTPEENDLNAWLQAWLVDKWGFELEACLKEVGAKHGRFLNISYFSKTTSWLPTETRIPSPWPMDHKH